MISKKEVQHIAQLARLGLGEKEIEKMQKELSAILNYIEKLKETDVSNVDLRFSSGGLKNVMGEDEVDKKLKSENEKLNEELLRLAPKIKNGYLKVKQIL